MLSVTDIAVVDATISDDTPLEELEALAGSVAYAVDEVESWDVTASRIGGDLCLPGGVVVPRRSDGEFVDLLLQLHLDGDLAARFGGAGPGVLIWAYDSVDVWPSGDKPDRTRAHVWFMEYDRYPPLTEWVTYEAAPADTGFVVSPCGVSLRRFVSLPTTILDGDGTRWWPADFGYDPPAHSLFASPTFSQDDPRTGHQRLVGHEHVLQLGYSSHVCVGDAGTAHVFTPPAATAALRLAGAWFYWDCS